MLLAVQVTVKNWFSDGPLERCYNSFLGLANALPKAKVKVSAMARQDLQLGSRAKVRTLSTGKTEAKDFGLRAIEVATVTEWLCTQ